MTLIPNKPGFLPEVHALRGIGAICIVLFHLSPVGGIQQPESLNFVHNFFGSAVILFFVLSGFSLYLTTSSKTGSRGWVRDFYLKRFFRIAPMFYLVLAVQLALMVFRYGAPISLKSVLANVFFVFNFFPGVHESYVMAGWIIGIEAIFYAVFPALLVTVKGRPSRIVLMLLLLAMVSVAANVWFTSMKDLSPTYHYMNFLTHSVGFGAGIAACYLFGKAGDKRKGWPAYTSLAAALVLFILMVKCGYFARYISPGALRVPLYAFCYGSLALALLFGALPFLTNRLTLVLGELSYSIYLLHPIFLVTMKPYFKLVTANFATLPAYLICAAITLLAVVSLSYVTYRLVEAKGIRLGKRFTAARASGLAGEAAS